jgi:hypothetical protein
MSARDERVAEASPSRLALDGEAAVRAGIRGRDRYEATRELIRSWLLAGGPQPWRDSGEYPSAAGGVAGLVGADGAVEYLYPEITGYFLQWLAASATRGNTAQLAQHARHAQDWLSGWVAVTPAPPTRVYLRAPRDDWRNHAIFCFDHAMVLRGLSSAAQRGLLTPEPALVAAVCAQLESLIAEDGLLDACRVHGDTNVLPHRWSTRRGGFLAKAAAGILNAEETLPVPSALVAAARASHADSLRRAASEPHEETHPFLYAFEGLLARMDDDDARAALPTMLAQLDDVLADFRAHGRMRETHTHRGRGRLDIVAQALRVVLILRTRVPALEFDPGLIADLLDALADAVRSDGSLPFALDESGAEANTWTAMFAEQAFAYAGAIETSSAAIERFLV